MKTEKLFFLFFVLILVACSGVERKERAVERIGSEVSSEIKIKCSEKQTYQKQIQSILDKINQGRTEVNYHEVFKLGLCYYYGKSYRKALYQFSRVSNQAKAQKLQALALHNIAITQLTLGQYRHALRNARNSYEALPHAKTLLDIIAIEMKLNLKQAVMAKLPELEKKIQDISPDSTLLGHIYLFADKPKIAKTYLQEAYEKIDSSKLSGDDLLLISNYILNLHLLGDEKKKKEVQLKYFEDLKKVAYYKGLINRHEGMND